MRGALKAEGQGEEGVFNAPEIGAEDVRGAGGTGAGRWVYLPVNPGGGREGRDGREGEGFPAVLIRAGVAVGWFVVGKVVKAGLGTGRGKERGRRRDGVLTSGSTVPC